MTRNSTSLKIVFSLLMFIVATSTVFAQRGEKIIGVETGFNSHNKTPLAGVFFSYRFSNHFQVSPNVQYVFKKKHTDAFIFNCDFQVPFNLATTPVDVYPLAGLSYASWNFHDSLRSFDISDDVSSRYNHFGLNFGGGLSVKCSSTLRLKFEARYSVIKDFNTTMVMAGIGYSF